MLLSRLKRRNALFKYFDGGRVPRISSRGSPFRIRAVNFEWANRRWRTKPLLSENAENVLNWANTLHGVSLPCFPFQNTRIKKKEESDEEKRHFLNKISRSENRKLRRRNWESIWVFAREKQTLVNSLKSNQNVYHQSILCTLYRMMFW